jgi:hypothetical protein
MVDQPSQQPPQQMSLGEITDRSDPARAGKFLVKLSGPAGNNAEVIVNYTSPYANAGGEGGMIAIPPVGTLVLVAQIDTCGDWFYLGSTLVKPPNNASPGGDTSDSDSDSEPIPDSDEAVAALSPPPNSSTGGSDPGRLPGQANTADPEIHRTGVPQQQIFQNEWGCGLKNSGQADHTMQNYYTRLKSGSGKKIALIDSPGQDCVLIKNDHNDRIILTSKPEGGEGLPQRSLQVETHGPQKYICGESQMDLLVNDGRELNIENKSTGHNADPTYPERSGNVNIQSRYNDVNIFSGKPDGRIFIETLSESGNNQVIEIETHGDETCKIRIRSTGKIDILAEGEDGIGVEATKGSIDINAAGDVNIKAGGEINLKSSANTNIDASPDIYLNSKKAKTANPNIGNSESHYSNKGLTTYSSPANNPTQEEIEAEEHLL